MIDCSVFYNYIKKCGISFFAGVPDSLLKNICAYISDCSEEGTHIIAANEGNAVGLAIGHYLATGTPGLVYMQNSGQGNAVNPLLSLADSDVYGIPMVLLVGWRGQPGIKDEPQHVKQGKVTAELFATMGISCSVLPDSNEKACNMIAAAVRKTKELNQPVALLVRKNSFSPYVLQKTVRNKYSLTREEAIGIIAENLPKNSVVVSTTGMASRELYEYRDALSSGHEKDFLTVGGMGHASQIALGIALKKKGRPVVCLDGDGAALMHLGGMGIVASQSVDNYKHIVLNNGIHGSVGGQPTIGFDIDFCAVAAGVGYKHAWKVDSKKDLKKAVPELFTKEGPCLLEVCVSMDSRPDLGRPKSTPSDNKEALMEFLDD